MDAGRRRRTGVRGESIGPIASLQENLVCPGKPGRRHRRWPCGGDRPRKTGRRAIAGGFCHLGDRPVAFRQRQRLDRGAAVTVTDPGLVVGVLAGVVIARLVVRAPVERDVIEE